MVVNDNCKELRVKKDVLYSAGFNSKYSIQPEYPKIRDKLWFTSNQIMKGPTEDHVFI